MVNSSRASMRSGCFPPSTSRSPSGTRGTQKESRNVSRSTRNGSSRDERSKSRGGNSGNAYEEKSHLSMNDSLAHPGKKPKESAALDTEVLFSPSSTRHRRSREFTKEYNASRLIQSTVPFSSNKGMEQAPLSVGQSPLAITNSPAKEFKYTKKQKGGVFKFNGEFLRKTLDGMERWLLKNENSFSMGDLAALSPDREGSEEDSPLEQLLNCALQIYHWGRTHGDSDLIVWRDRPSDVRKAFNSAILELGSNSYGKPNYKSQNKLILRMRYNPSRSYSDLQPKDSVQDICIREYAALGRNPYATPLRTLNVPNPLAGDEVMANPYSFSADRKLLSPQTRLSSPSPPQKSSGGKFWDLLSSSASDSDLQDPLHWYRRVVDGDSMEDESFISSILDPQDGRKSTFSGGREYRGLIDSANLLDISLSSLNLNSTPERPLSKPSTQSPTLTKSYTTQYFPTDTSINQLQDDDEELGKLSASLLYIAYLGFNYEKGSTTRFSGSEPAGSSTGRYSRTSGGSGNSPESSPASEYGQMNQGKKHGRRESDDDDGGKGSEPPKRKKKLMSAQEINQRLACPYAKGDPTKHKTCIFIHRRDLPGVSLTLHQDFDVHQVHASSQTIHVSPAALPLSTIFSPMGDPPQSIAPLVPMRTIAQQTFPNYPASISAPTRQPSLATGLSQSLGDLQNPLLVQASASQAPESKRTKSLLCSDPTQSTIDSFLSFDNLNHFFENSIEWLRANTNTNPQSQLVPDRRSSSYEFPDTGSARSSPSDVGVPILTPRSSHESLSEALVADSEFDQWFKFPINSNSHVQTATPPATAQKPNCGREKKYLLLVARKPALPKGTSSETSSSKKFYFDNMEEFKANFENWMKVQFYDPGFCWGWWELENPERQQRLPDIQAVIDELEFMWLAHRSNEAALFLVGKHVDGIGWDRDNPFLS
ncbi:uncharacterized protein DFL_005488 [Arthrobotrys flagrans]|uniref:Uncharacterized protein n=1 Tax=Arthrobotrys flagrans TaxID=97331 RepID=A0A436ZXS2_ARTFL|nr:hypothetical protein DFL_005488 [Arthrobotrys flagrans]